LKSAPREVVAACAADLSAFDGFDAIVVIDVIRATTTLATALATGRRCFPVGSVEDALALAQRLEAPLLAGEVGGVMPDGFELNNSPAALAARDDVERPLILLTTSGTRVIASARSNQAVFAASLRNLSAEVERLVQSGCDQVALVGARTRGEFRREDQLCCGWLGASLIERGFRSGDAETAAVVERWAGADVSTIADGHSAGYLRRSGQLADLDYVLDHVDDLDLTFAFDGLEVIPSSLEVLGSAA
jgi:2-phosphosulfolactate phosphatase